MAEDAGGGLTEEIDIFVPVEVPQPRPFAARYRQRERPGLKIETYGDPVSLEDCEHRRDRRFSVAVDRLAAHCVSAVDLVSAETCLQCPSVFEYRRRKNRAFAWPKFALAVKPEGP